MANGNTVVDNRMDDILGYLDLIVEPTFADYQRNPHSARHAFLACVAVFHCIDRFPNPKNTRKAWGKKSIEFLVVDMFAHHLKHVKSSHEKHVFDKPGLPLSFLVNSMDFHNLYFAVRDSIKFIREQLPPAGVPVP
jgi:hypothetical protein